MKSGLRRGKNEFSCGKLHFHPLGIAIAVMPSLRTQRAACQGADEFANCP
jgi:hypothetical protein